MLQVLQAGLKWLEITKYFSLAKRFYGSPQLLLVADYPSQKSDNLQKYCLKHGYLDTVFYNTWRGLCCVLAESRPSSQICCVVSSV